MHNHRRGGYDLVDVITGTADRIKRLLKVMLILIGVLAAVGVCIGLVLVLVDA